MRGMARCTICCQQEEVRLVATNVCLIIKDGEKYDLLPPIGI